MEEETVNARIVDAVAQTNFKVVGESPAESLALATQAMGHAVSLAMENATQTQGGMQQINNTSTAAIVSMIVQAGSPAGSHQPNHKPKHNQNVDVNAGA